MKFPFFNLSKKTETKQPVKVLVTPPRLANTLSNGRNSTDTPKNQSDKQRLKTPEPILVTGPNGTKEPLKIPVPIQSILSQLPTRAQEPNARSEFANATVQIPAEWIVPQLPKGKASVRLPDLARLLPAGLLRLPLPPGAEQQEIVLPLANIISAIPPEALAVKNQTAVDMDSPELNNLPALIDDALLQKGQQTSEPSPAPVQELVREAAPEPLEAPENRVTKPEYSSSKTPETTPTRSVNPDIISQTVTGVEYPSNVSINLKSLVAVMPDRVFACARTELWRKANLDTQVKLPIEPLLPQLHTAQAKLPISTVIAAMPEQLFVSPLPQVAGESVRIPLEEIIPQLPPALFSAQLEKVNIQSVQFDDNDLPDPFQEKTPPPSLQQIRQSIASASDESQESTRPQETLLPPQDITSVPEPAEALQEPVETIDQGSLAIADEVLADESFSLFSEGSEQKPQSPESPIAQSEVGVPTSKDNIDITPVSEETASDVVSEPVNLQSKQGSTEIPTQPSIPATKSPDNQLEQASEESVSDTAQEITPVVEENEILKQAENVLSESPSETFDDHQLDSLEDEDFLIDVNKCTASDLTNIQGVGPVLAERIIAYRNERGPFKSIEDLRNVPGVGRKTFRTLVGRKPGTLNRLLNIDHDRELTLQEIVQLTSALPGIAGCSLAMSDGLFLSGRLPEHLDHDTVSAFAPQLFKKVGRYARELRVGQIRRLTIFTDQQPVSIFQADEIYLIVVHDPRRFSKTLLYRCERIGKELGRICRQRAIV